MKRVLVPLITAVVVCSAPAAALARRPVDHAASRGWLYANTEAQAAAEWIFPRAAHAFGTVTNTRGCDRQVDGSYICSYDLAVWSSGHWYGDHAPPTVEAWSCPGPMAVTIRRTRHGAINVESNENPCRPRGAADSSEAGILFVAAVHRREPGLGRVSDLHCLNARDILSAQFHCYARTTKRERERGDVDVFGNVALGDRPTPTQPAGQPPGSYVDCPDGECTAGAPG